MTRKAERVWLKRRSGSYQFRRLIVGVWLEPRHYDDSLRRLGWPLGRPGLHNRDDISRGLASARGA